MTRINVIPPSILTDEHLLAEYHELPRIFTNVKTFMSDEDNRLSHLNTPKEYTLGPGHMKFFYRRLDWLLARYRALYKELIERGFNIDIALVNAVSTNGAELAKLTRVDQLQWKPTPKDYYLNMARLAKRSKFYAVMHELT